MASMPPINDGSTADWQNYLGKVFDAPANNEPAVPTLFNVLGLHPYRTDQDQAAGRSFVDAAQRDVTQARSLLSANGAGGKQVWVTEVGVTTAGSDSNPGPKHVHDEQAQATVLKNIYQGLRNDSHVQMVIIHRFADTPANGPPGAEPPGYGVLTHDLTKKDAYKCLQLARGAGGSCP
jgi:hypothetical protein